MLRSALLAGLACSACSTYYSHTFYPAPLEVRQQVEGDTDSQARVLVTVIGIRKPNSSERTEARVEVRLRLENLGANSALLLPGSLSLVAADLRAFGEPVVRPDLAPVPQGGAAVYEIFFPLAEGSSPKNYDLAGLNLGWAVDFGDQIVQTGVSYARID